MNLVVLKFGGSSLADDERLAAVAERIGARRKIGKRLVVVVSAMGGTTDELIARAHRWSAEPPARELDLLLATGEQAAAALLAMAIEARGLRACALTGAQAGLITDGHHTRARLRGMDVRRVRSALESDRIVVVCGDQGVSHEHELTTLGRGGSDTTAVALAIALGAGTCEIYSDVDGVYTADPKRVRGTLRLETVDYDDMLELSAQGTELLALPSIELAREHQVEIEIRSSFTLKSATRVRCLPQRFDRKTIVAVTHDEDALWVRVTHWPREPQEQARAFERLADSGLEVDGLKLCEKSSGEFEVAFTLPLSDGPRAERVLAGMATDFGIEIAAWERDLCRLSLVGAGMRTQPGILCRFLAALSRAESTVELATTSANRASALVRTRDAVQLVTAIHDEFMRPDHEPPCSDGELRPAEEEIFSKISDAGAVAEM